MSDLFPENGSSLSSREGQSNPQVEETTGTPPFHRVNTLDENTRPTGNYWHKLHDRRENYPASIPAIATEKPGMGEVSHRT